MHHPVWLNDKIILKMAGIYLHIPFCRKACHYCNFHFSTSIAGKSAMVAALQQEMGLRKDYLAGEKINTIYIGGGTPSLLSTEELQSIIDTARTHFHVLPTAEITLEANPDDINTKKLTGWKAAGINRLSIGIQSFFEADLQWMNRAHNALQAADCIQLAKAYDFHNLTVDLIYGTPTLTDEKWKANVAQALALEIPHLSCYALTVEPKTALDSMVRKKTIQPVSSDQQARQFLLLIDWLETAGYEHYEISNFSLPGHRSLHNSAYWQGTYYLGIGPSAHSFNGHSRQWNLSNNALYLKSLQQKNLCFEMETLSPVQQLNEYIMTSLRTMEGLSLRKVNEQWGAAFAKTIRAESDSYQQQGLLTEKDDCLILTKPGRLMADGIASDLFADD
jgi:oxygen-independent coproporphyrinogen III oxidase